jgi:hypothetical protein
MDSPAYQEQLARAGRLYERVLQLRTCASNAVGVDEQRKTIDDAVEGYSDDVWSFFIHAWHVRDWIKPDDSLPTDVRDRILAAVNASRWLCVCADLANGRKHLELSRPRVGAALESLRASWTSDDPMWRMAVWVRVGGDEPVDAVVAACEVLRAWKGLLESERLALPAGFPDLTTTPPAYVRRCD